MYFSSKPYEAERTNDTTGKNPTIAIRFLCGGDI